MSLTLTVSRFHKFDYNVTKRIIKNINCILTLTVSLIAVNLHQIYVEKLLHFIAYELERTIHVHFYLLWIESILTEHGSKMNISFQMPLLLLLQKNMQKKYDEISKM